LAQLAVYLAELLKRAPVAGDVLDVAPVPVRNAKRRGRGWLAGEATIGFSWRLGWFAGVVVLTTVGATLVAIPQRGSRRRWSTGVRRWAAGRRQIVETSLDGCCTPSGWSANGRTPWRGSRRGWRPRWRCTICVAGSTGRMDARCGQWPT